jgi:hypothetical protein
MSIHAVTTPADGVQAIPPVSHAIYGNPVQRAELRSPACLHRTAWR